MYWITSKDCIKCGKSISPTNEKYRTLKSLIIKELKTKPSDNWPDECIEGYGFSIGMIKIYVAKKKHEFFKYKMKCFLCGYEISGEEFEKLEKILEEQHKKKLFKTLPSHPRKGQLGLYNKAGMKTVNELEQFL